MKSVKLLSRPYIHLQVIFWENDPLIVGVLNNYLPVNYVSSLSNKKNMNSVKLLSRPYIHLQVIFWENDPLIVGVLNNYLPVNYVSSLSNKKNMNSVKLLSIYIFRLFFGKIILS